jgi:hypothetical protein
MEALRQSPLLPVTPKQRGMVGTVRTNDCIETQYRSRGSDAKSVQAKKKPVVKYYMPKLYGDRTISAAGWAAAAVVDVLASTLKSGNHVCRNDVCHKGRIGRLGFCRMMYWHWVQYKGKKGLQACRRAHGLVLQKRWNGLGQPPVHDALPLRGLPVLETNHPFHNKLTPGVYLGPRCNHDLGILLRLPIKALACEQSPATSTLPDAAGARIVFRNVLGPSVAGIFACAFPLAM